MVSIRNWRRKQMRSDAESSGSNTPSDASAPRTQPQCKSLLLLAAAAARQPLLEADPAEPPWQIQDPSENAEPHSNGKQVSTEVIYIRRERPTLEALIAKLHQQIVDNSKDARALQSNGNRKFSPRDSLRLLNRKSQYVIEAVSEVSLEEVLEAVPTAVPEAVPEAVVVEPQHQTPDFSNHENAKPQSKRKRKASPGTLRSTSGDSRKPTASRSTSKGAPQKRSTSSGPPIKKTRSYRTVSTRKESPSNANELPSKGASSKSSSRSGSSSNKRPMMTIPSTARKTPADASVQTGPSVIPLQADNGDPSKNAKPLSNGKRKVSPTSSHSETSTHGKIRKTVDCGSSSKGVAGEGLRSEASASKRTRCSTKESAAKASSGNRSYRKKKPVRKAKSKGKPQGANEPKKVYSLANKEINRILKGLTFYHRTSKWSANIWVRSTQKQEYLGAFFTVTEAARAYDRGHLKYNWAEDDSGPPNYPGRDYSKDLLEMATLSDLEYRRLSQSKAKKTREVLAEQGVNVRICPDGWFEAIFHDPEEDLWHFLGRFKSLKDAKRSIANAKPMEIVS